MSDRRTKLEDYKSGSRQLRGTIADELASEAPQFSTEAKQLLKFHGLYEQDDRDARAALRAEGKDRAWSFMIRSRIPGGRLGAEQYLVHDDLAKRFANGTLRITTRQALQLHGVIREDLRSTLQALDDLLVTTLGACGDVVRNVMCCPAPSVDPVRREIARLARCISDHTAPRTGAYHEIWLDGQKVSGSEPLYSDAYLPRKFKLAIAVPGDNCVDVFTQDLGLIAVVENGTLAGYNVLVGGGLGMTHKKPGTFPRLADPMAFVGPSEALETVDAIVRVQRDHGDRTDRRHARLKYLIHDRGIPWFRAQVEKRLGRGLAAPRPTPDLLPALHHGWHRQGDGRWYRGIFVENGRLSDEGPRLLTAIRRVVERLRPGVALTPSQDLLLTGLLPDQKAEVDGILGDHGVIDESERSAARLHSMACPALPTCGLALAEAERELPSTVSELETVMERLGLGNEKLSVRMTGCPNGCARPYVADLAFVGRSLDRYVILVGGRIDGTRLNRTYADLVPGAELVARVTPLLVYFRDARRDGETFGDFCDRVGIDALRAYADDGGEIAVNE